MTGASPRALSISYGKDSLACLGAIERLGWPLDRIITADVWATDTIPADLPPMVEFKAYADQVIKDRWGLEVEHVRSRWTYEAYFHRFRRSKGTIYGWPFLRGPWCNGELKVGPLDRVKKGCISYLGIAADETTRVERYTRPGFMLPLVAVGWSEADCRQWCQDNGLLSPVYTTHARGGCWFCHNQSVDSLRCLRHDYPEYWDLMLQWDQDSPVYFTTDHHTIHDYDARFQLEDDGLLDPEKRFRWAMLDEALNYRLF